MGIVGTHPAVCVRVANKGDKSRQRTSLKVRPEESIAPHPPVFVSVASKELSPTVSLLFATLAGRTISVAAKGLTGAGCWRESNWGGPEDFEAVRRTTWRGRMVRRARRDRADLTRPL